MECVVVPDAKVYGTINRALAQSGSARDLGSRGRLFESDMPDHSSIIVEESNLSFDTRYFRFSIRVISHRKYLRRLQEDNHGRHIRGWCSTASMGVLETFGLGSNPGPLTAS